MTKAKRATRRLPIAIIVAGAVAGSTLTGCGGGGGSNASLSGGLGAAAVLPASSFAFASIDLNPSDGEKGQLIGTLLKFPVFAQNVKIGPADDVRAKIWDQIQKSRPKGCTVTYDADIKPWLGSQFGVAGVVEGGQPTAAFAVQVTDEAKARAAIAKISTGACDDSHGTSKPIGIDFSGGWMIAAQTQKIADDVMAQTAQGALANDASFKQWTAKTGTPGFANVYAGPSLGGVIAKALTKVQSGKSSFVQGFNQGFNQGLSQGLKVNPFASICPDSRDSAKMMSKLGTMMSGFQGAALTVRARNGGVELEGAMDTSFSGAQAFGSQTADLSRLPATTAAALSLAPAPTYWDSLMTQFGKICGPGFDRAKIEAQVARATGLSVPGDINALLGHSITLALGGGTDLTTAFSKPATAPVALLLNGDTAAVQTIVTSLLARTGAGHVFSSSVQGSDVVLAPTGSTFAGTVTNGSLGSDPTFKDVIPNASNSPFALYVNFDQLEASFGKIPAKILDNLKVLKALGLSVQQDGTAAHLFLRISTN